MPSDYLLVELATVKRIYLPWNQRECPFDVSQLESPKPAAYATEQVMWASINAHAVTSKAIDINLREVFGVNAILFKVSIPFNQQ